MVKALKDVSKRLQNMRMQLRNYDLTVVYRPGIEQYIADALSRSLPTQQQESKDVIKVNTVSHILTGEQWRESIIRKSNNDKVMRDLKGTIMKGWPEGRLTFQIPSGHTIHTEMSLQFMMAWYTKERE